MKLIALLLAVAVASAALVGGKRQYRSFASEWYRRKPQRDDGLRRQHYHLRKDYGFIRHIRFLRLTP
jgi:hypothetical protein